MDFRITGLSPQHFQPLFALSDSALADIGAQRCVADDSAGFPCRVSVAHAEPGEELLLLSYEHQAAHSPYRAAGPIFVRKAAAYAFAATNVIPDPVRTRLLSVRAYDAQGFIVDADIVDGSEIETLIERLFVSKEVSYLHIHYARRGCYACRVDRVCRRDGVPASCAKGRSATNVKGGFIRNDHVARQMNPPDELPDAHDQR